MWSKWVELPPGPKTKKMKGIHNKKSFLDPSTVEKICGDWTRQPINIPTMTVYQSVEKSFVNSIEKMITEPHKKMGKPSRSHPLIRSLLAKIATVDSKQERDPATIKAVHLECVSKKYEDSFLIEDPQNPCIQGDLCEGILMALDDIHTSSSQGFVCKKFICPNREEDGRCLLCIRKQVSLTYYQHKAIQQYSVDIIQPHRNIISVEGEYKPEACIYPSSRQFEGITDPFVRHERHHYQYYVLDDGRKAIKQVGVDFRQVSMN